MILVAGGLADSVTELVCARLEARRLPYRLLDLGRYPHGYQVDWSWESPSPTGRIACADWALDLDTLTGVFVRFPGAEGRISPPGLEPAAAAALHAELDLGLSALFEALPCRVVNRSGEGYTNHSKPLQALIAREQGFLVPETLVTDDPDAARAFVDRHGGEVIYKSLSGVRSIVRKPGPGELERLDLLRNAPSQFQERVRGADLRVHTVGEALFATRIRSDVVDYRYASREGGRAAMEPAALDPLVERACFALTRRMGLEMAGIDLKETADGLLYCLEVNPCPGFVFYERGTGQPISDALADLLAGSGGSRPSPNTGAGTSPCAAS